MSSTPHAYFGLLGEESHVGSGYRNDTLTETYNCLNAIIDRERSNHASDNLQVMLADLICGMIMIPLLITVELGLIWARYLS